MKKYFSILVVSSFVTIFIASSVLAMDTTKVGTLKSINPAKSTFVFRTADTKETITLKADKHILKNFQENDKISVTYDNGNARSITKVKIRTGARVHAGR